MIFHEGDHVRDRITHRGAVVLDVYSDGWLLIRWENGDEDHAEPADLEPDPYYHR
jgi:hypothetical protein